MSRQTLDLAWAVFIARRCAWRLRMSRGDASLLARLCVLAVRNRHSPACRLFVGKAVAMERRYKAARA